MSVSRFRVVAGLAAALVLLVAPRASAISILLDLDAHSVGAPASVPVYLDAGTYMVGPVGMAAGGQFDAWSAWPANLNCGPDHICERGWENEFEYSSPSLGYIYVGDGFRYDDPLVALSHAVSSTFTLLTGENVMFGLNDCSATCLGDNRGGNSLQIESVPEPASLVLLGSGLAACLARRRSRS